jgi:hypothetical protein
MIILLKIKKELHLVTFNIKKKQKNNSLENKLKMLHLK